MLFLSFNYQHYQQQQHPFNSHSPRTTRLSQYQKSKIILDLLEQKIVSGSGISWALCKYAPRPIQITTPAPHHSVFYSLPTNSKALKASHCYVSEYAQVLCYVSTEV